MTQNLEPIAPQKAVDLYLAQREDDASERIHLWRGGNAGWKSPSEGDMTFLNQLYFWCKGD